MFTAFSKVKQDTQNMTEIVADFDASEILEKHKTEINRLIRDHQWTKEFIVSY